MVRILRLVTTVAGCFCHHEVCRVINGQGIRDGSHAFWHDVMAIIRFAAAAGRFSWDHAKFGDGRWRTSAFHHFDPFRPYGDQGQPASDGMSDERLKILCTHALIFSSDALVFGTLAVQDRAYYFVEHDTWKFRTTS